MVFFLLIVAAHLFYLKEASFAPILRPSVSLSSNTFTFLHRTIKKQVEDVPVIRGDLASKPKKEERPVVVNYCLYRDSLGYAAKFDNKEWIEKYLDFLYQCFGQVSHADTMFDDMEHGKVGLMHYAVLNNNPSVLDLLLNSYGACLELRDSHDRTPLALAVSLKLDECIILLVREGARVDYQIDEFPSLLHYAAHHNKLSILKEIRIAGHDLTEDYCNGWKTLDTPLELAVKRHSYDCAYFLHQNGASFCNDKMNRLSEKAYKNSDWNQIQFFESTFGF